jgi:hypothetical protein
MSEATIAMHAIARGVNGCEQFERMRLSLII